MWTPRHRAVGFWRERCGCEVAMLSCRGQRAARGTASGGTQRAKEAVSFVSHMSLWGLRGGTWWWGRPDTEKSVGNS